MLTLRAGASSIVVAPEYGAGLVGWMRGSTSLLRRALPQAAVGGDPHAMGCYPLLPYGNRIGNGRFRWDGVDYQLAANFGDHPHTIHGIGWESPWTVINAGGQSVLLALEHQPDPSWPFAFDAALNYQLSHDALTIAIQMTNRHTMPAPAGIGVHPYFPKANDPSLRFNATGAWVNGPDSLPLSHGPLPTHWQHAEPRLIVESRLDNCFTGWDGIANILAGPASLRIEASDVFSQLQVFTPAWADFFCVEPVTHVPDAVNRPDLPPAQRMRILEPGQTLAGTLRFVL